MNSLLSSIINLFLLGDIYSFNTDDWEPYDQEMQLKNESKVKYRIVDVELEALCNLEKKFTYFPDKYNFQEGTQHCMRFGGSRIDVASKDQVDEVVNFLWSVKGDPAFTPREWVTTGTKFTDKAEMNVWRDVETGELPQDPFNWFFGEPNGGDVENCAELWIRGKSEERLNGFNDIACSRPLSIACQSIGIVTLTLRGAFFLTFMHKRNQSPRLMPFDCFGHNLQNGSWGLEWEEVLFRKSWLEGFLGARIRGVVNVIIHRK